MRGSRAESSAASNSEIQQPPFTFTRRDLSRFNTSSPLCTAVARETTSRRPHLSLGIMKETNGWDNSARLKRVGKPP